MASRPTQLSPTFWAQPRFLASAVQKTLFSVHKCELAKGLLEFEILKNTFGFWIAPARFGALFGRLA